jgi:hypothetical protein
MTGSDPQGNDMQGNNMQGNDMQGNDVQGNDIQGNDMQEDTRGRLRAKYRGAFGEWALQINRLQAIAASQPAAEGVQEAQQRAESAEVAYRRTRDRLTEDMANDPVKNQ